MKTLLRRLTGPALWAWMIMEVTSSVAYAQSSIELHVKETIGIRRRGYPIHARVPFPAGVLTNPGNARLRGAGRDIVAQIEPESHWPDGSVQWLSVDFNVNAAPGEEQMYEVEHGAGIRASKPNRGLAITETPDAIQVGNIRFGRSGSPLILSVKYREEVAGRGLNGFVLVDDAGREHSLRNDDPNGTKLVKSGPHHVVLQFSGAVSLGGSARIPYSITADMPHSKSWVKLTASFDDPQCRVREIVLYTAMAFKTLPRTWDFGTGSWTYGQMRGENESVTLKQVVDQEVRPWEIVAGSKGEEQPYETAGGNRPNRAEGWGHFQDPNEGVAFAVEDFGRRRGTYAIALEASGQLAFRFAPASPEANPRLTVYLHYVPNPPQISAGTSPPAMLQPLVAVCDAQWYQKCGVPVPAEAVPSKN